ncbi:MAG: glutamine-hydrolyzing GMP synthase [Thermoplasmata archaeon]
MFDASKFIDETIEKVREEIDGKAVVATSGGVDSAVAAVIVSRAIGDNLLSIYVDTGLMRKGEREQVASMLENLGVNYEIVDAKDEFFAALKGVLDPEEKRMVIGGKFIEIFERKAKEIGAEYLVQGTIAPDWIESGGDLRDTIKSHHNVGALPEGMELKLVEPLRDLYKDEVRKVGRELEVTVSERQPFPGPALAIRILGEVTPEAAETARDACAIVEEEIEESAEKGDLEMPWQYFAGLLPIRSVGVRGDIRAYGYTIFIRAVQSVDGMTASYSRIPHEVLDKISIRITNELPQVNRVVYDVTNKPPGTIEWE